MVDEKKINEIKRKISKEFPEFKGVEPQITEKKIKPQSALYRKLSLGTPKQLIRIVRLRFKKKVETVDKVEIERILTVSLNEEGEIIKITGSR